MLCLYTHAWMWQNKTLIDGKKWTYNFSETIYKDKCCIGILWIFITDYNPTFFLLYPVCYEIIYSRNNIVTFSTHFRNVISVGCQHESRWHHFKTDMTNYHYSSCYWVLLCKWYLYVDHMLTIDVFPSHLTSEKLWLDSK